MLQAKPKVHSPRGNNTTTHCGHRGHQAFLITLSNTLLETKPTTYSYGSKDKKPKLQAVLNGPFPAPSGRDAAASFSTQWPADAALSFPPLCPPNRGLQCPFLCPLCGARDQPLIPCYAPVHEKTAQHKCYVNQTMIAT